MASSTKLWAGSQLLTKSSWDSGWWISARRVTAWDQLPRGDAWHTWDSTLMVQPGNQAAGAREVIRHTVYLGQCARQAPGHLSCLDLGRAQNKGPNESVPLWSTQEPEPEWLRPGKCRQTWACFGQSPWGATRSLSSVDQETQTPWAGSNPVWPRHCEHSPHRPVIFVCSVPPSPKHN